MQECPWPRPAEGPASLAPVPPPPRSAGPVAGPLRRNTSLDTSSGELSSALLGAIQRIVLAAIRKQVVALPPPHIGTPSDVDIFEEEAEGDVLVPMPPVAEKQGPPSLAPQEVPPQWLARFAYL
ncbi:UNVERIFIED_CONTAM: hypothetical protein Slati_3752400 [Sesamum latifolium]|uniref:Uncharacterized protein n=1 Tax=Sesamum latifolium TaxID=2727402 RepID=A0AAW2U437_9LAMI